jgi:hypothetical protein
MAARSMKASEVWTLCHLQLNRRPARGRSPRSLQLNAKSLSQLAGRDRGAMAGAFRQEDVIWPSKDPQRGINA